MYVEVDGTLTIYPVVEGFNSNGEIMVDGKWITPTGRSLGGDRKPNLNRRVLSVNGKLYLSIQDYCRHNSGLSPTDVYGVVSSRSKEIGGRFMRLVKLGDVVGFKNYSS